jgi:hypothetical protein
MTGMETKFAAGLRESLVAHVQAAPARRRQRHLRVTAGLFAGLVLTGAGAATATQLLSSGQPGGDDVTPLGQEVTVTRTGSASVDLGPRPAGATEVAWEFTCLSPGTFKFPGGSSVRCNEGDVAEAEVVTGRHPLLPGEHMTRVETDDKAQWRLTASYVSIRTTDWETNPSGQTYGVANEYGTPDLVAVVATNGRAGYADARQINGVGPSSLAEAQEFDRSKKITVRVPVYEADGRTQIGEFPVTRSQAEQDAIAAGRPMTEIQEPGPVPREPVTK